VYFLHVYSVTGTTASEKTIFQLKLFRFVIDIQAIVYKIAPVNDNGRFRCLSRAWMFWFVPSVKVHSVTCQRV